MKLVKKEPKKVYIAGPMSGIEENNHPAFYHIEEKLKSEGYEVVNPARITHETITAKKNPTRRDFYRSDFHALLYCDAIFLLKGWDKSHGAQFERQLALEVGCQIFYEDEFND